MTIHAKMLALCAQSCQEIYRGFETLVTECMDTQQISQLTEHATAICNSYLARHQPNGGCTGPILSDCIPAYIRDEMRDDLNYMEVVFSCGIVLVGAAFIGYQICQDSKRALVLNSGGIGSNRPANPGDVSTVIEVTPAMAFK